MKKGGKRDASVLHEVSRQKGDEGCQGYHYEER
jgi:hypothetical protein